MNFDSIKARHSFWQHGTPLVKTRRMNYNLTLKRHVENLTEGQGHYLVGIGHVGYRSVSCIRQSCIRSVSSAWTRLWCFHRSSLSLSKVIAENSFDLSWPDWPGRHDEVSLVAIFRFRVAVLPVTRCLRVFWMIFVPKRRLSIFSH